MVEGRPHRAAEAHSGIAVQTRGHVDAQDGAPAPVCLLDCRGEGSADLPVEAGTEHRVDHHVESAEIEPGRPGPNAGRFAALRRRQRIPAQTGRIADHLHRDVETLVDGELPEQESVSAVVAVAAEDRDAPRPGPLPAQAAQGATRRALHEHDARHIEARGDRAVPAPAVPAPGRA